MKNTSVIKKRKKRTTVDLEDFESQIDALEREFTGNNYHKYDPKPSLAMKTFLVYQEKL